MLDTSALTSGLAPLVPRFRAQVQKILCDRSPPAEQITEVSLQVKLLEGIQLPRHDVARTSPRPKNAVTCFPSTRCVSAAENGRQPTGHFHFAGNLTEARSPPASLRSWLVFMLRSTADIRTIALRAPRKS